MHRLGQGQAEASPDSRWPSVKGPITARYGRWSLTTTGANGGKPHRFDFQPPGVDDRLQSFPSPSLSVVKTGFHRRRRLSGIQGLEAGAFDTRSRHGQQSPPRTSPPEVAC